MSRLINNITAMTQTDAKKYDFIQKNYLDNSRLPWEREGAGYRPTNNSKMEIAPDGKFGEDSTYASHYPPKIGQRNDAIKPQGQIQIGGKFEGNSNYSQ